MPMTFITREPKRLLIGLRITLGHCLLARGRTWSHGFTRCKPKRGIQTGNRQMSQVSAQGNNMFRCRPPPCRPLPLLTFQSPGGGGTVSANSSSAPQVGVCGEFGFSNSRGSPCMCGCQPCCIAPGHMYGIMPAIGCCMYPPIGKAGYIGLGKGTLVP